MSSAVLVLNADYTLLEVIPWQQAVLLLFRQKVRIVEEYAGRMIRSPSIAIPFPAVVALVKYVPAHRKVRLTRKNILCRDAYTCQYCGRRPRRAEGAPDLEVLTIDHVVPRALERDGWVVLPWNGKRVRVTSWENVLTACAPCNTAKGAMSLKLAGMSMRRTPRAPSAIDVAWMSLFRHEVPDEWKDYLPKGSPWANYWDVELDPQ
ncbi:MAG: HNH endonuclease [Proteobacteria bacterium]|jgi:5-methylcytosine-specific restriction endonuclease McrA|nr:HNH endonuclease [Pseudomonadota bacterium]